MILLGIQCLGFILITVYQTTVTGTLFLSADWVCRRGESRNDDLSLDKIKEPCEGGSFYW
jgi:hypothetical protein